MILGAWLVGVACGAGYIMILNEILGRRMYKRMVRRFEQSGRIPPLAPLAPLAPDDPHTDLDISDENHPIQHRAW